MSIHIRLRFSLSTQPINLPVFNPVALELLKLLNDPHTDVHDVIHIISEDPSLAAQVLKMANSPSYSGRAPCETIKNAAIRLGSRQLLSVAMAASHASLHSSDNRLVNDVMQDLWHHSHACALGCRTLAIQTGQMEIADHAYLAGLMHDIGKLYLLKALENMNLNRVARFDYDQNLLHEVFSEMHVEFGCRVMDYWNIPEVYRSVVAHHHDEQSNSSNVLLAIVRLVNVSSQKLNASKYPSLQDSHDPGALDSPLYIDDAVWSKLESSMNICH